QMSKTRSEEEEYWNSSKFKAFTFDDEDDEFTQLRESKRAVNSIRDFVDEDEDDIEKVSWSGDVVGSKSYAQIILRFPHNNSSSHSRKRIAYKALVCFFSETQAPGKCAVLSFLCFIVGRSKPASLYSLSDGLDQHKFLNTEKAKPIKDFSSDWSPEDTVRRMQKGKPYSLERFRSLKDKLLLLDEAVRLHDGNSITAVLIFLQKSLSKEVLLRELETRQVALEHFIHLLKENQDHKLLQELLRVLGRTEEVALLQYREYLNIKDENKRKEFLKSCIGLPFLPEDMAHVQDHYTLLERQIIMEASDKRVEAAGQVEVFKKYPRKASILNMPLITTLYYSCFYHYTESEGTFSSPANLKKTFKLSDKQYLLVALAARAKLREWREVDNLFTTKNWLGYTKKRAPIGFHRIVDILHRNNAPVQVLQEYVCLVDDTDLRLNLALKYKCHSVVIDVYKDLKDRQQLMVYRCKLARGSLEERKIDDILSNTQIRWKN
uniref:Spermatogenesis-defective protein 39 homolog n=1 Tax=Latimeria chalumnae TaxID=7897 RepID=H3B7U4_LATCH